MIIERVLSNLLSNAIKYTLNNGRIEINCERSNHQTITIEIIDYGSGINTNDLENVFKPYYQSGKIHEYSTGLGLTFCKIAVEAHGGTITIAQGKEKGTVVKFTIPQAPITQQKHTAVASDTAIHLSEAEKEQLRSYLTDIESLDISEITAFRQLISKMQQNTTINSQWLNELNSAVLTNNELKLKQLINLLKTKINVQ